MADLLQSQIQESCRLALPEGLKDLMSDISREVLRAQPPNLLTFIADYLSVLLVTRENLSIASVVCKDVCNCGCQPELESELRYIGMYDEDVAVATEIISQHFNNGGVNEANILTQILKCTAIDEEQLLDVQEAIRNAFLRHQANHTTIYESSSESDADEIDSAVRHTLNIYKKTNPDEAEYEAMAKKIQASYHAYGVQRHCELKRLELREQQRKNVKLVLPGVSSFEMMEEDRRMSSHTSFHKLKIYTVSSTSLAGSYMKLPKYRPYSAHNNEMLSDLAESPEKEHAHIDYTSDNPHISISTDEPIFREKKISFAIEDDDNDSVPEIIGEKVHEEIDDVLIEEIYEDIIVTTDEETEASDVHDENVVAIDMDMDMDNKTVTSDDKMVKSDSNNHSPKDDDDDDENIRGSRNDDISDDVTEYVMHKGLSVVLEKDSSGQEL